MDFEAIAYPDTFEINGEVHKGSRSPKDLRVLIPYTVEPVVNFGDVIVQKLGSASRAELKVIDMKFMPNGTMLIGTKHPHLLTLTVENMTSNAHKSPAAPTISIGSNSGNVQIGSHNQQITNISLQEVVQKVAEQGDPQTKGLLRVILENPTVSTLVGVAATAGLTKLLAN